MTLRYALTGAHGVGKTYIVEQLKQELESKGYSVCVIESPTRYVKSLGFVLNETGSWQTQLLSGIFRVERQLQVPLDVDVVLSDRCLNDELAYNAVAISKLIDSPKAATLLAYAHRLLVEFWLSDVKSYWTKIYYKGVHPDFEVEDDGDRDSNQGFQHKVDHAIKDELQGRKISTVDLPLDRDESVEFVLQQILSELKNQQGA